MIAEKIESAESESSCELLAVFAKRSDDYSYIPILWAAIAALLLPAALYVLFPLSQPDIASFSFLQLLVFVLSAMILRLERFRTMVVPKRVKIKRAAQTAQMQFAVHGLNGADAPPAILFFVSFDERYVQIITNAKVQIKDNIWQEIIDKMLKRIKAGSLDSGMIEAVGEISEVMAQKCPAEPEDGFNRFPNRLIVL